MCNVLMNIFSILDIYIDLERDLPIDHDVCLGFV